MRLPAGRRRVLLGLALVSGAAIAALAVVLATEDGDGARSTRSGEPPPAIEAEGALVPRITLFGDTIRARLDVTLDRRRVDPDSVRVAAEFSPWALLGRPQRTRRDGKTTTFIRTTYVLRCLTGPCVPPRETAPLQFDPAQVTYGRSGGRRAGRETIEVAWPLLVVHSRIVAGDAASPQDAAGPWRADLLSLPAVSYRAGPRLVLAFLLAGGVLFALGGVMLAYLAFPRRVAPAPAPPPEEPPPPALTPLEQALALLEDPARANGAADQRRALELVAEEIAERDPQLSRTATALAWSEDVPPWAETSVLASRVRSALAEDLDGHVE